MFKKNIKNGKIKAQTVVEGSIAFLISMIIFIIVVEFALYFHSIHASQALADDINANISVYNKAELCSNPEEQALNLIENKAKKYLDNSLTMEIEEHNDDRLVLVSSQKSLNRDILNIEIVCSNQNTGFIVRSNYLYRGFFALKAGFTVHSLSSVQTPKF